MQDIILWLFVVLASVYIIFRLLSKIYAKIFSIRLIKAFKKDRFGWHSYKAIKKETRAPDWYLIAVLKMLLENQTLFKQLIKSDCFELDDFLMQHDNVLTLHNYEFKLNPNKPRGKKRKMNMFLDLPDLYPEPITA